MVTRAAARGSRALVTGLVWGLFGAMAWAQEPKEVVTHLDEKEFFRPDLTISSSQIPLEAIVHELPNQDAWRAFRGAADAKVYVDPRGGTAVNIIRPVPLIPGSGVANRVTLADLGRWLDRPVEVVDEAVVADAALHHVLEIKDQLGIDVSQLGAVKATRINPDLWQVHIPQVVAGVPVRYGRVTASISHGNLVVVGTESWGNVALDTTSRISAEQALAAGFAYAEGRRADDRILQEARLEIVPFAPAQYQAGEGFAGPVGRGYGHRLVWTFVFQRSHEDPRWEVMVEARSGEVIAFQDLNHTVKERIRGGVYPLTSTEQCPDAQRCGTMQPNQPMPWANTGLAAPDNFTNSAGVFSYATGTVTTTLSGKYVRVIDSCGSISESTMGGIDLGGTNGQHDCTSAGSSAGDTPAARSAFYEVNKIAEQARGWLPANTWLRNQVTANVNINLTCNGFWNGSTINFYRSGGGCRNTGEIAAVFDHEWGHGMDDNDANGFISNSGEAYADIAAIYRLQASCVGYGFDWTQDRGCGMTADGTGFNRNEAQTGASHCDLDCSGVRDSDWNRHADHQPDTALGFVCTSCNSGTGPCGRQVHCSAAPVRQAAWDLVARDLPAAPFNLDSQSAFLVGNKLFYHGSGNVGTWHSCTCGGSSSGCAASNGYMQWITADDDNGNLNDGTPHMTAIFNAYNRHGIACASPTAQNSGCAAAPVAPTLSAGAGYLQVALSWPAVAGASRYWVFRTEGYAGCNFGKALVADLTGTAYTDTEVANDRAYSYNVVAVGASSACYSRASNCATATPSDLIFEDGFTTP